MADDDRRFQGPLPKVNLNDLVGDVGIYSLLMKLSQAAMPGFEVPRNRDYGIDVIAYVTAHNHALIPVLDGETEWTQRRMAELLAVLAGAGPESVEVPARLIGFQVKTRSNYDTYDDVWNVRVEDKNLRHWGNSDFPIILVASDAEGNLRFADVSAFAPDSRQISLTEELTVRDCEAMRQTGQRDVAVQQAKSLVLELLDANPERQIRAVRAAWLLLLEPRVVRFVIRNLAELDETARIEAVALLAAGSARIQRVLRDDMSLSAASDHRPYYDEWTMGAFARLSDAEWLAIARLWPLTEATTIRLDMLDVPGRRDRLLVSVEYDPWPDLNGAPYDQAKATHNAYEPPGMWDAVTRLLRFAPDPEQLVIRLAADDLKGAKAGSGLWWGSLLRKVSIEIQRGNRNFDFGSEVKSTMRSLENQVPDLRTNPEFQALLNEPVE